MSSKLSQPVEVFAPPALEDSKDFTDAEAGSAECSPNSKWLAERLAHLCCTSCGCGLAVMRASLKRHAGVHFSRITLACANDHTESRTFRLDWLKGLT